MSHSRRHPKNIVKRQAPVDPNAVPTFDGVNGVQIGPQPTAPPPGSLAIDPNAPTNLGGGGAQPLASVTPTIITGTSILPSSPTNPAAASDSPAAASSASSKSQLPIGTVVAACVGALVGAIFIISVFLWWIKRPSKARGRSANARGRADQRQTRGLSWNRLGDNEDKWEGNAAGVGAGAAKVEMRDSQKDADEKNFPMFKKTMSMRTTRTAKALEEHGIDLPPLEFSQYHPTLAEELSLEHPDKPFATRQNSGSTSWDRETVGDDSFLSLRSVRVDSGTMSPTTAFKVTPQAVSDGVTMHKWESAEVVHMEGDVSQPTSNPFADVHGERLSRGNPFFGAQEIHRDASKRGRSRSNSRGSRHSRNTSRTSRTSRPTSRVRPDSEMNPFNDEVIMPVAAGIPPFRYHHAQSDSVASGASGSAYATEQAMKNLIAALNLSPEEVEERLRIASMQASEMSRYSHVSGLSTALRDNEDDVATVTGFPPPSPLSPNSPHAR